MIEQARDFIQGINTTKQTVLKNTAWLTFAEIGARVARGGLSIVAARMLGATGMGVFAYALALGGFLTFFEDAGIGTFVTRSFARNELRKEHVFGTAFVLKVLLGLIAFGTFVGIGPIISTIPAASTIIPVIALLLLSDGLRSFFFSITRAEQRMHVDSTVQIITNVLIVFLAIGLMIISPTPLSLALGYTIGSVIGTIIMFLVVRRYLPNLRKNFSKSLLTEIFMAAWPFTVLAISNVLIFNTDTLFLGHYSSVAEVGYYGAASRLVQMLYILPVLFATSTFPVLVQKIAAGEPVGKILRKIVWLMLAASSTLTIIMIVGAKWLVPFLFGVSFAPAIPMVTILGLTYIPVFIGSTLNNVVMAHDRQKQFVIANIWGIVANIALDFILVPRYGGIGAAIASVVGLSVITMVTAIKLYTTSK